MITKEEWDIIKPNLIPGCYCGWKTNSPQNIFQGHTGYTKAIINKDLTMSFPEQRGYAKNWSLYGSYLAWLIDFCYPDGTNMLTNKKYSVPTKEELICKKIASLDQRFKTKKLPKCITKSFLRSTI